MEPPGYDVVVPVKTLHRAKSRLHGLPRARLMLAFALDALAAAVAAERVRRVHVVTDEPGVADGARDLGCAVLPDRGEGDLNRALRAAAAATGGGPVAALLGDLPCLLPGDLDDALRSVDRTGTGFVADAAGTGTTLLAVTDPSGFDPHFGAGSAASHREAGFAEVAERVSTLRQDVDTAEDLAVAVALGVGPRTLAALAA